MQNTNSPLTDAQIAQYQQEGFLVLGRVLDDETLEALRVEESRFRNNPEPAPHELTIFRSQLCPHSETMRRVCTQGAQVDYARQLVAPDLCYWYNQFVTKLPDGDSGKSEFPWHQDNHYLHINPATNATIWIALDDVDEHNGCVWMMPQTHQNGLLDHSTKEGTWHQQVMAEGDGVAAVLKAGEAIAFTGLTLHRSKLNHSDAPRRALLLAYADAAATHVANDGTDKEPTSILDAPQSWVVAGAAKWPKDA